jgi:O-antigen ligase
VALHRGWESAALTVPGAVALGGVAWWSAATGAWSVPGLATLGEVLSSRTRIFAQGLELAAQRPWGGWGSHLGDLAGPLGGVGRYHVDDLALPHFHSLPVQTLFEAGAPGLMALALWFGFLFVAQRGPWRAAAGAALVGFLVTQGFDLAWHHATVAVSVMLVAVLGLGPPAPPPVSEATP